MIRNSVILRNGQPYIDRPFDLPFQRGDLYSGELFSYGHLMHGVGSGADKGYHIDLNVHNRPHIATIQVDYTDKATGHRYRKPTTVDFNRYHADRSFAEYVISSVQWIGTNPTGWKLTLTTAFDRYIYHLLAHENPTNAFNRECKVVLVSELLAYRLTP